MKNLKDNNERKEKEEKEEKYKIIQEGSNYVIKQSKHERCITFDYCLDLSLFNV